jgi:hypothetical protein
MAITWATLADGQLAASKGTLYTAVGQVAITAILLVNTDSASRTVNLYIKRSGGTSRRIAGKDISLAAGGSLNGCDDSMGIRLSNGDLIEGDASSATVVDFMICGVTR